MTSPDLGAPTTLVLVRHASTEHTQQRLTSGDGADPPLTAQGRGTARLLAGWLGPADVLLTSPSRRARATADVLAGPLRLPVRVAKAWHELRFGDWEGLSYAEIARGWPEQFRRWPASTSFAPPGGGESLDVAAVRVLAARDALVAAHPARVVVVVTHVTPIRTLVRDALAAGPEALWRLRVDPTSVTTLRYWPDGGTEVAGVNSTGHLVRSLEAPERIGT